MEQKRKRINRAGPQVTEQLNHGKAIIHEIDTTPGLHKSDGVHLTSIGNAIFLNTMQEALMSFFNNPEHRVYKNYKEKGFHSTPIYIHVHAMTVLKKKYKQCHICRVSITWMLFRTLRETQNLILDKN